MLKTEISIVIPVYNVEGYLPQCVAGILGQSFPDFELILVNDGSKDGSPAVCDRLAGTDPRIRVIHQENGGVSRARNRGIDEARGEFVVFVDADDAVKPNYLQDLISAQQVLGSDCSRTLILADYQPFNEFGPEPRSFPKQFSIDFVSKEGLTPENFRELIFDFRLFPPYCKLYRMDVINKNGIRFREGLRSAEDFEFNIRYLSAIDRVEYIDSVQYDYRVGYKSYVPSNHGVLGKSEIDSAHIMAHGIIDLAKRMEIYEEICPEIDLWAANKHYFNRLRMLFKESSEVKTEERRVLYQQLISDEVYYGAAHRGAKQLPKSLTKLIAEKADRFTVWRAFYAVHRNGEDKH